MCIGGGPSMPAVPAPAPAPPPAPQAPDQSVVNAGNKQKAVASAAAGPLSTMLTGPMGLQTPAQTTNKTQTGM